MWNTVKTNHYTLQSQRKSDQVCSYKLGVGTGEGELEGSAREAQTSSQ